MTTMNDRKELFSLAYIQGVAARAGFEVMHKRLDRDSVDCHIVSQDGRCPQIHVQAKGTSRDVLEPSEVVFPLPLKNYDDLRQPRVNPAVLVVVVLPTNCDEWFDQTEDELVMRRCGYWVSLLGSPEVGSQYSVTVRLPRTNVFSPEALIAMMQTVQEGGLP